MSVPSNVRTEIIAANLSFWFGPGGLGLTAVEAPNAPAAIFWEDSPCGCVGETTASYEGFHGYPLMKTATINFNAFHYNSSHATVSLPGSFFFEGDPYASWIYNSQYIFFGVAGHEWGHFWGLTDNNFGGITCAMYGSFTFGTTRSSCSTEISILHMLYFFGP